MPQLALHSSLIMIVYCVVLMPFYMAYMPQSGSRYQSDYTSLLCGTYVFLHGVPCLSQAQASIHRILLFHLFYHLVINGICHLLNKAIIHIHLIHTRSTLGYTVTENMEAASALV